MLRDRRRRLWLTAGTESATAWLTASDLRIYDHYRSQVMLTESYEPSSPDIGGA